MSAPHAVLSYSIIYPGVFFSAVFLVYTPASSRGARGASPVLECGLVHNSPRSFSICCAGIVEPVVSRYVRLSRCHADRKVLSPGKPPSAIALCATNDRTVIVAGTALIGEDEEESLSVRRLSVDHAEVLYPHRVLIESTVAEYLYSGSISASVGALRPKSVRP